MSGPGYLSGEVNAGGFTVVQGRDDFFIGRDEDLGVLVLLGLKRCMECQLPDVGQGLRVQKDLRFRHGVQYPTALTCMPRTRRLEACRTGLSILPQTL